MLASLNFLSALKTIYPIGMKERRVAILNALNLLSP
jgi:hypothetical protein